MHWRENCHMEEKNLTSKELAEKIMSLVGTPNNMDALTMGSRMVLGKIVEDISKLIDSYAAELIKTTQAAKPNQQVNQ